MWKHFRGREISYSSFFTLDGHYWPRNEASSKANIIKIIIITSYYYEGKMIKEKVLLIKFVFGMICNCLYISMNLSVNINKIHLIF